MTTHIYYDDLTKGEKAALQQMDKAFKALSKRHWFFAANGTFCIMRKGDDGRRVVLNREGNRGGMDLDYITSTVGGGCDIDGGDW